MKIKGLLLSFFLVANS